MDKVFGAKNVGLLKVETRSIVPVSIQDRLHQGFHNIIHVLSHDQSRGVARMYCRKTSHLEGGTIVLTRGM